MQALGGWWASSSHLGSNEGVGTQCVPATHTFMLPYCCAVPCCACRAVQQGVDLLLQPLEGVMTPTQADSNAAAGTSTSSGSNGSSTVTSFNSSSNWGTPEPSAVAAAAAAGDNWAAAPAAAAAAAGQPVVAAAAVGSAGSKPAAAGVQRGVAAAAAAVPSRGAPVGDQNPGLSGLWVKVPERSDTGAGRQ